MKRLILSASVVTLGVFAFAATSTAHAVARAHVHTLRAVDDPPPEPVECPFCGGNAQVHAKRLIVIESYMSDVALYATRW